MTTPFWGGPRDRRVDVATLPTWDTSPQCTVQSGRRDSHPTPGASWCGRIAEAPWGRVGRSLSAASCAPHGTAQVAAMRGHLKLVSALLDAGSQVSRTCYESVLIIQTEHAECIHSMDVKKQQLQKKMEDELERLEVLTPGSPGKLGGG